MLVRHLLIQSKDRIVGTPDNFSIKIPPIEDLKTVNLLSASIPNTLYNVTSTNNTIYWNRGGALSATLAPGAYDSATLSAALKTAMDTADGVQTYTITFSETTMKLTIACTAAFTLTCTNNTTALWYILGWNTTANTGSATSQTADNALRLDFPAYLIITIREFSNTSMATTANFRGNYCISMRENSQYVEVFNVENAYLNDTIYTAMGTLSNIDVTVKLPDGTSAGLNGADWSCLLALGY
jgi:hypothetical protein